MGLTINNMNKSIEEKAERKELDSFIKLFHKINTKYYGTECKDWYEECCVCQVWKAFNVIKNEYEK